MKPTLQMISDSTGFSTATVSNALNQKKGVNAQTAAKVLEVAQKLGYFNTDKLHAVRFVQYRRNGHIVNDTPFFTQLYQGVEAACRTKGCETYITILSREDPDYAEHLQQILHTPGCGVLMISTEADEADMALFAGATSPLLLLDNWPEETQCDALLISNTDSACHAVEYLINSGHTEIGYLKCKERIKNFFYRQEGYLRALALHGLTAKKEYEVLLPPDTTDAWAAMRTYLDERHPLPSAFFADNDFVALGALKAFEEHGICVPEDVSIIGFDDIPFSAYATPPLTTVHVPIAEMGMLAVNMLFDRTENPLEIKTKTQICTQLVLRGSVQVKSNNSEERQEA